MQGLITKPVEIAGGEMASVGASIAPASPAANCPYCHGTGRVVVAGGAGEIGFPREVRCSRCGDGSDKLTRGLQTK